jgi:uncharacterized protein (TIGR02597 family)
MQSITGQYHKRILVMAGLICGACFWVPRVGAQANIYTDAVGLRRVSLLTNSDTIVSQPFTRVPAFRGLVESVAGSVITVSNSPGWSANQWATPSSPNGYYPYFVVLASGAKEGAFYTITNSSASALDVALAPEDLGGVGAGDKLRIVPYWTLGTVFPGGRGVAVTSNPMIRQTQVLFPAIGGNGINLAPTAVYYYYNNGWRKVGAAVGNGYDDVVMLPDQYVIVRQSNGADTTQYSAPGQVVYHNERLPLYAQPVGSTRQDNYLAVYRPKKQSLNESGLSNAVAVTGTLVNLKDEVLTFDNTVAALNKSASAVYYYYNNGWRKVGMPVSQDAGASNVFLSGQGVIVRRATNSVGVGVWVNPANYSK